MQNGNDTIVTLLAQKYDQLGTYRAVAESLDNAVSCGMIWNIINDGAYSHKVARALGFGRKYPPYLKIRTDDMGKAATSIHRKLTPDQVDELISRLLRRETISG